MEDKDKNSIEDLFRSKLYDFEAETSPDDWNAIVDKLDAPKARLFPRVWRYWAAAAVIALLFLGGSVYLFHSRHDQPQLVQLMQEEQTSEQSVVPVTVPVEEQPLSDPLARNIPAVQPAQKSKKPLRKTAAPNTRTAVESELHCSEISDTLQCNEKSMLQKEAPVSVRGEVAAPVSSDAYAVNEPATGNALVSDDTATPVVVTRAAAMPEDALAQAKEDPASDEKMKRWSFGMGGGSVTTGSSNSINTFALNSASLPDLVLMQYNSPFFNEHAAKTRIRHKMPFSFGAGISYALTNRLALQSGLTYSYLLSSWETNGAYNGKTKQKLHYLGIPLSLNYTIMQWHRLQWYANAGALAEVNVAGKLDTRLYNGKELVSRSSEHIRMKEWLWSVNAKTGLSYPLLRFLSVYGEVGVGYYFDNGSTIETVRSEKPFNVNLQAGFRFGF